MGEFALGQPVPRFEDPRLLRGGGRYVDDMVLPRMVFGHVLRSPHAHARIRAIDVARRQGGARRAGGADRRGLAGNRAGATCRSPPGCAARRRADVSATRFRRWSSDRVRWVGDYVAFVVAETAAPGGRRRRTDRGRLRAAAGHRLDHRRGDARGAARLGRLPGQRLLCPRGRRQGGGRGRLRPRRACRQAPARRQPGHRGGDGAARLDRRLQPVGRPLHDLHDPAAHPRLPRRPGARSSRCRRAGCASSPAISAAASA